MSFDAGSISSRIGLDVSPFRQGMLEATSIASIFPSTVTNFIANPLLGVVGVAKSAAAGISDAFGTGFKLAMDFEQAEVAFGVILGGAEEAKAALKDLSDFAAATPFEMPELVNASRSLLAFGTAQEDLIPALRAVGDVASAVGAPIGQLAELYGKARVQGRLAMEDINQLTGRGIPIIQELAKQFGVAEAEVRELVSTGKVNFSHLEWAFQSLTGEGGKFAGMMEKQSQTMAGQWSTLKDSYNTLLRDLATPVMMALQPEIQNLLKLISENQGAIKAWATDFGSAFAAAAEHVNDLVRVMTGMLNLTESFFDLIGLTDPNKRNNQPYAPASQQEGLFAGVVTPEMLSQEAGRKYLADVAADYGGAARAMIQAVNQVEDRFLSNEELTNARGVAVELDVQLIAYEKARQELEELNAAAAAGGKVSADQFVEVTRRVEAFTKTVERARAELKRLRDEEDSSLFGVRSTALVGSIDEALRRTAGILDQARVSRGQLDQQFPPNLGRPTVNIERVIVPPFDMEAASAELAGKLQPILREAMKRQSGLLKGALNLQILNGGL